MEEKNQIELLKKHIKELEKKLGQQTSLKSNEEEENNDYDNNLNYPKSKQFENGFSPLFYIGILLIICGSIIKIYFPCWDIESALCSFINGHGDFCIGFPKIALPLGFAFLIAEIIRKKH